MLLIKGRLSGDDSVASRHKGAINHCPRLIKSTVRFLRRCPSVQYQHVTETHYRLFNSLYPWAGRDRTITAPDIAIAKGGYSNLFAHPADCKRAAEYALNLGQDALYFRAHPGEVFGYQGNGRTILTIFAELTRRSRFHVTWEAIDKEQFLETLTRELLQPSKAIMDGLVLPYVQDGVLSAEVTAKRLRVNFNSRQSTPQAAP